MFMLIVLVLFYLVTISSTFNYESNILDPFWFNTVLVLCLISGAIRKLFRSNNILIFKPIKLTDLVTNSLNKL